MHKIALGFIAGAILVMIGCSSGTRGHLDKAQFLFDRQLWKEAASEYTKAIELGAEYAEVYNNRGIAFYNLGEYDVAIADYTRAIMLNYKLAAAHHNRGIVYYQKHDFNNAIADYDSAISLDPNYASAYYNRALAYEGQGKKAEAIADYEKAIELSQDAAFKKQAEAAIEKLKK